MEIKIGNIIFKSKAEAIKKCRQLQDFYFQKGNIGGEDRLFLEDLFKLHPRKESKLGTGIISIWCDIAPMSNTKCFWIKRNDGTDIDISWNRCLNKPDKRSDVLRIMRRAVSDQIIDFKALVFGNLETIPSDISGILLRWNEVHVDHFNPSFKVLAENWKGNRSWNDFQIDHSENMAKFVNETDHQSWIDYHKTNAKLRIISIAENLSRIDED